MKQKKKTISSNATLLDFFHAKQATPESGKPKAKSNSKKTTTTSVKRELIVIDSDSDDSESVEVVSFAGPGVKRRKLAETTSKYVASSSSVKLEDTRSTLEAWSTFETSKGISSQMKFGDPILLQPTLANSIISLPEQELSNANYSSEMEPHGKDQTESCLQNPKAWTSQSDPCLNAGSSSSLSSKLEVDIDLTLDSWETGDDEYQDMMMSLVSDEQLQTDSDVPEPLQDCQPNSKPKDAFSLLMSGHKENEAWKEADVAEDRNFRPNKSNGSRRKAPFYKVLQGMPIAVDAFRYGAIPEVTAYFLTHAHSDHYTNLSSSWKHGLIYCSQETANLIIHMLSVDKKWVHPLPMDVATTIPNTGGVQVTLIEANHCPGSSLFLFEGRQTVNAGDTNFKSAHVGSSRTFRYLHCGDFRASPRHALHPAVHGKVIDHIYLDTTYLDPKYTFPPQALVVSACADLASKIASGTPANGKSSGVFSWLNKGTKDPPTNQAKDPTKPVLFVIGTYSIGKERIVKAVAKALKSKVYCDKRKAAILRCQADPELASLLTSDPADAAIHLLPLGMINSDKLPEYLEKFKSKYSKVVGFRPTGWTYVQPSGTEQLPTVNAILTRTVQKTFTFEDLKASSKSSSTMQLYPIPYSEHSSFYELTCFALSLNWGKMIATVNVGSEKSRGKMAKWFSKWEAERKKRGQVEVVAHRHLDYW